jgi:hypothetical protein
LYCNTTKAVAPPPLPHCCPQNVCLVKAFPPLLCGYTIELVVTVVIVLLLFLRCHAATKTVVSPLQKNLVIIILHKTRQKMADNLLSLKAVRLNYKQNILLKWHWFLSDVPFHLSTVKRDA